MQFVNIFQGGSYESEEETRAIFVECSSSQLFNDEEAVKRSKISNGYNAVAISYDSVEKGSPKVGLIEPRPENGGNDLNIQNTQPTEDAAENEDEYSSDDEPFIPSAELELPESVPAPNSMKQAAVIEKTAYFVAKQGPQMEIVLKTKQANNPSFAFLTMGNVYNPYFKYVLRQIKMGRYHPQLQMLSHVSRNSKKAVAKEEDKTETKLNLPKVNTSGTSYAKLINQFKKFNKNTNDDDKDSVKSVSSPSAAQPSSEPNSRPESVGATSYSTTEETSHQSSSDRHATTETTQAYYRQSIAARPDLPEGPVPNQVEDPEGYAKYYEKWQAYYHWYYQYYSHSEKNDSAYSQSVQPGSQEIQARSLSSQVPDVAPPGVDQSEMAAIREKSSIHGKDGGDSGDSNRKSTHVQSSDPPEAIRPIIDKMAEYVARNGVDFEAMVRVKNDTRFQFLDSSHPHHQYYQRRRREAELSIAASQAKRIIEEKRRQLHEELASETETASSDTNALASSDYISRLKTSKTDEDGDTEMDVDDETKRSQQGSISFQFKKENVAQKPTPINEDEEIDYRSMRDEATFNRTQGSQGDPVEHGQYVEEKEEGEISPTTDDCVDEVERKLANKLAAAAREKLARVNRESVKKEERKKRAAAFLAKVKATEIGSSLASRLEKKRRAEEEKEKERERERAAVALEIANRSREKALPAAYSVGSPIGKPVITVANRPVSSRARSPDPIRRSHHRRDRDRERNRDRERDRDRRRSRSRSRERRDHHHRSGGHNRRHNERR